MLGSAGVPAQELFRPPAPLPCAEPLGPIALLKALWKNPLEAWTQAHFEEPIVVTNLALGQIAVVSEPAAIRRVLLDNSANYRKDTMQRRIMSAALSNGLLLAEQEQWRVQRRTLAPIFALRNVMAWAPGMLDAADALVERWRREPVDSVVDAAAEVTLLTLDVLERTIFSDGLGRDPEEVRVAWRIYFDTVGRIEPFDLLGLPEFVPRLGRLKARSAVRLFRDAVDAIIETRRRRLRDDPTRAPRDLLTLLLEAEDPETGVGLSETEIRGNILTFIAAGHETTANTITWALFLLSQSEGWRARVTAEAQREIGGAVDGLAQRLVETRAVIDEAIRLYPPLPAISRAALERDELAGQEITPGSMVVIAPYLVHRHRMLWERPDCFDPARFLGDARNVIPRFAYMPFGLGPRTCIGSSFALQAATLAVATILANFELELVPGERVWPTLRVTLRPAGGLPMRLRPHRSAA